MKKKIIRVENLGRHIGYADVNFDKAKTFTLNKNNRPHDAYHLSRIKREMLECLEVMPPITVNVVTNNIVEGQHRHKAFIELIESGELSNDALLGVKYVSIPQEFELEAIRRANNNSKSWTLENYVGSNSDIDSYAKLIEWCKTHTLTCENDKVKVRYGSAIVKGKGCTAILKKGTFNATDEEFERAEQIHDEMIQIIESLGKEKRGPFLESLATTWISFREQHDFSTWMKELNSSVSYQRMPSNNSTQWKTLFAVAHSNIDMKKK